MATLHALGWEQGSLLIADLQLCSTVVRRGAVVHECTTHGEWLVASQDCDLAAADACDSEPVVELRPLLRDDPPQDEGIRSAKFLLARNPRRYLLSTTPRTHISPAALLALSGRGAAPENLLDADQRTALKTWLGLRYDRPAVPEELVALAKSIAQAVKARRAGGERVRDVLMQFDTDARPPRYSLYAVLSDAADADEVRDWLAHVALRVPQELGIGDVFEARPARGISLRLIETSYAADVTQITWGKRPPRGAL